MQAPKCGPAAQYPSGAVSIRTMSPSRSVGAHAVAAVRLDRAIEREHRSVGGDELGDVRRLAGIAPAIVKLCGALGRELRELELGIGLGKRVGDRLVRADRGAPDAAIVGIAARRLEREARQAVTRSEEHTSELQ